MKQVSKEEGLKITIQKFEKSKRGINDYVELFLVFHVAIRPDDKLTWDETEDFIKNSFVHGVAANG